ncbi:hypothetical protein SCLCIDRAFT_542502 [Scleroderma citrinum Foug A]|uniref:Uncharacterized protein n=1 Tax=Scleroderma citrinum Foug A TaxID=1036808 RepID=A0A0C3EBJ2_9AGAM|nr:hypothetical protein SCLCIDRAFT_542502 [Scleroderma citrinum Foug A]
MPSLRRSASSPSVRSSPYPLSLSSASALSSRARMGGQQPRRSSGSDTSERRVLADIEWWRVADGQCPPTPDTDQDEVQPQSPTHASAGGAVTLLSAGGDAESPQTPLSIYASVNLTQLTSLDEYFPLSTSPNSPTTPSHGRYSSFSSVESTPEVITPPLSPLDLGLGSPTVVSPFDSPLGISSLRSSPCYPLLPMSSRSFSFGGFSNRDHCETHFTDLGGDSFSLDQNLFS